MTVTATPVYPQTPKAWSASIGNGDAQNWKLLKDNPTINLGAGANGAKVTGLVGTSTDSSARDVQLALVRAAVVTMTIATPGVLSLANHNLSAGDQVFLSTTGALPTGLTAGTPYFVIAGGLTSGAFELGATAGGSAIATSGSQSGVHTLYIVRTLATVSLPITAGTVSGTPAVNFLNLTNYPGVSIDNDGNPYINLEGSGTAGIGDFLAVAAPVSVTANKIINVSAQGANF